MCALDKPLQLLQRRVKGVCNAKNAKHCMPYAAAYVLLLKRGRLPYATAALVLSVRTDNSLSELTLKLSWIKHCMATTAILSSYTLRLRAIAEIQLTTADWRNIQQLQTFVWRLKTSSLTKTEMATHGSPTIHISFLLRTANECVIRMCFATCTICTSDTRLHVVPL